MEWIGAAVLVLVVVLLVVQAVRRRAPGQDDLGVAPQDEADLARAFEAVDRETGPTREKLLASRLEVLRQRRVPARRVRQVPGSDSARLAFADGTVLIVRSHKPGELYVMAVILAEHPVCVQDFNRVEQGTVVHLVWPPRGSLELEVLGLDQAD